MFHPTGPYILCVAVTEGFTPRYQHAAPMGLKFVFYQRRFLTSFGMTTLFEGGGEEGCGRSPHPSSPKITH